MEIRVNGFGILKALVADPSFALEEGTALSSLMDLLMKKYGQPLKEIILDPETNRIHSFVCVLLNGKLMDNLDEALKEEDKVTLFIPVSGG